MPELDPEDYDIVLISYGGDSVLGFEVLRACSSNGFKSGVVLLTTQDSEGLALEAIRDQQANDYLVIENLTSNYLERTLLCANQTIKLHKELEDHRRRLVHMATTDPLTDLPNRHYLIERLELETLRARRHGRNMSVVMLEPNPFGKIIDSLGHVAGDSLLAKTARILSSSLRATDLAGRYSGQKFAIVLNESDQTGAHSYAERLNTRISYELSQDKEFEGIEISCCMGIAQLDEYTADVNSILNAAHGALRLARMEGNGKIMTSNTNQI
jgi:two-component system cell cycle response regulator